MNQSQYKESDLIQYMLYQITLSENAYAVIILQSFLYL
jgi:hypothetical protein